MTSPQKGLPAPTPGECIVHQGYICRNRGYGGTWAFGRWIRAHRAAYCVANGLTPEDIAGLVVLHRCDNPGCVNPDHLELGTQSDNIADRHQKGRTAWGEGKPHAKLNPNIVAECREVHSSGLESIGALARKYGVDRSTMSNAINRKTWVNV